MTTAAKRKSMRPTLRNVRKSMSRSRCVHLIIRSLALTAFASGAVVAQEWKPERNVEMVVNSGAGGAADRQARIVHRALQALPGMPSLTVTNRTGGGGIVALTFMTQHPGDAHYVSNLTTA